MNKYTENITTLATSFKESFKKDDMSSSTTDTASPVVTGGKVAKLTKPAKVPSWSKDMSLETYTKQIETWMDINDDVPEYVKYHDFMEELKKIKDIKGLQR